MRNEKRKTTAKVATTGKQSMLSFAAERASRLRETVLAFLSKPNNAVSNWEREADTTARIQGGEILPVVALWRSGANLSSATLQELLSLFHCIPWLLRESKLHVDQWKDHTEAIQNVLASLASCVPPSEERLAAFYSSFHALMNALNGQSAVEDVCHGLVCDTWSVTVKHKHAWSLIRYGQSSARPAPGFPTFLI
jgi:hypothetical protein